MITVRSKYMARMNVDPHNKLVKYFMELYSTIIQINIGKGGVYVLILAIMCLC